MAGPAHVGILISVQNRASHPLRRVKHDLKDFRNELVRFNRNLFTASAVFATFAMGFRRAFRMTDIGTQFEFIREQFVRTFGADYIQTLRQASRFTVDSLSLMRTSIENHARGMSKFQTEKILTLSVGAAKLMGKETGEVFRQISHIFQTADVSGAKTFLQALNVNNQFKNMTLLIGQLTKGLNAAGMNAEVFRKMFLAGLAKDMLQFVDAGENSIQVMMMLKASTKSLTQTVGGFLSRAMGPLLKQMAIFNFDILAKMEKLLFGTSRRLTDMRDGLVDFIRVSGGLAAAATAALGGLSLISLASATLGFQLRTLIGVISALSIIFKAAKGTQRSWGEALADLGTELRFYFEIFKNYKDGVSSVSGEIRRRFEQLDKGTQERIKNFAKAFVFAKEAMMGFMEGVNGVISRVSNFLSKLGVWNKEAKRFNQSTLDMAKTIGRVIGATAIAGSAILGGGALFKMLMGLVKGGPKALFNFATGGLFAGKLGTRTNPMYVRNADGMGGAAGGLLTGGGLLALKGKIGRPLMKFFVLPLLKFGRIIGAIISKINPVLRALGIGLAIGTAADAATGGALSDAGAKVIDQIAQLFGKESVYQTTRSGGPAAAKRLQSFLGGSLGGKDLTFAPGTEQSQERLKNLMGMVEQSKNPVLNEDMLARITRDNKVEEKEMRDLLRDLVQKLNPMIEFADDNTPRIRRPMRGRGMDY